MFRERGREGKGEGEKHQCVFASCVPPTGDLAHNPGMFPDWELNQRPFGSQPVLNPLSYTSQGCYGKFLTHRSRAYNNNESSCIHHPAFRGL